MPTLAKTFLILDGNALLHRAWHSLPQTMTTSDGTIVNAAYGFTMIVERLLKEVRPDYMAVAWDLAGPTFRHDEHAEYKATRVKKEQALYDQIPIIQEVMTVYGIPSLSKKGFEADDILGTIAKMNKKKRLRTIIVTGDLDSLQLVDETTSVMFFIKGISETKIYDPAAVRERFGFEPKQLIDYKALAGDTSDNLKGVEGIGEKSAKELIAEFGSVEGIYKALKKNPVSIKASWRSKFEGHEDNAVKMKRLVTIVCDVDLDGFKIDDAKLKKPDQEKLVKKFRELEFRTLLKKYGAEDGEEKKPKTKNKKAAAHSEINQLKTDRLAVAIETQPEDLFGGTIKSIALSDGEKTFVKEHPGADNLKTVTEKLLAANLVIGHDLKAVMHTLHLRLEHVFDTRIAAYLLNSSGRAFELPIITLNLLRVSLPEHPSAEDAAAVLFDLHAKLAAELEKEGLTKVLDVFDMPVLPVLYEMEREGIKVDVDFLATLSKQMHKELEALTKNIYKAAGKEFNVNSPSQLADILFETLEIPTTGIKRTKTGYSTAVEELEKIEEQHEIVPFIMEYRELAKLVSTYVDALPNMVQKDGRIHTTFDQTGTATGRISSLTPNLQNIPIKSERGREIRKAFIADERNVLIAADYSQIELRLVAIMAKDESFLRAFKEGADIHKRTAAEIFEIQETEVTKDQRRAAKTVNFAVLYGMGARNLAKSTGLSFSDAKMFIEKYFEIHHAVKDYMDAAKTRAHTEGFVETFYGRKRYFPEMHSGVGMLVAQAERMAANMPIQGTEADIVKMAMIEIDTWLTQEKIEAHQLLQVHDEIVLEVSKKDAERVGKQIKKIMEGVVSFEIPMIAEVHVGKNWGEMEDV
ncbi:MAG: DNA polymerase I [Patescibacteria group bacterium]